MVSKPTVTVTIDLNQSRIMESRLKEIEVSLSSVLFLYQKKLFAYMEKNGIIDINYRKHKVFPVYFVNDHHGFEEFTFIKFSFSRSSDAVVASVLQKIGITQKGIIKSGKAYTYSAKVRVVYTEYELEKYQKLVRDVYFKNILNCLKSGYKPIV